MLAFYYFWSTICPDLLLSNPVRVPPNANTDIYKAAYRIHSTRHALLVYTVFISLSPGAGTRNPHLCKALCNLLYYYKIMSWQR